LELREGLNNWKLRLILSALLCIMGLGAMISMVLGLFIDLSVYDRSLVAIAIFMVGVPAYLIISGLASIDEVTIAGFLNDNVRNLPGNAELLTKDARELDDEDADIRDDLVRYLTRNPVANLLPDKPVKQAYLLLVFSMVVSFAIWYFAGV
jgi:hypothetical protein